MARLNKTEPASNVSGAAAAPARRKTAAASRTPHPSSATKATAVSVESVAVYSPAQEEIAGLAYSYWISRGCQGGFPEEDWLRAEQELVQRAKALA